MYLYKIILKQDNDNKEIYLWTFDMLSDEGFNIIYEKALEESKWFDDKVDVDKVLDIMEGEYGFRLVKIKCEKTIDMV